MPYNFRQTWWPVLDVACYGFLTLPSSFLFFDNVVIIRDTARRYLDKSELNKLLLQRDSTFLQIKIEEKERIGFLHSLNLSTSKLQA